MNIQKMLKQAQEMQSKMADMQRDLEARSAEGQAGNGLVKLTLTGKGTLTALHIDPQLLSADEKEVLEDLIIAAHREAKETLDEAASSAMNQLTGGLQLPAGMKLPF